ncbi:unnamed protein product [Vicia faba]|uniref:Uncharacterized protein n=1 Tax=Vicia faba TaxID=3906 RepID=A0AAV0ZTQ7_VICFA|nr:unnamed protein product [Vicia faba]
MDAMKNQNSDIFARHPSPLVFLLSDPKVIIAKETTPNQQDLPLGEIPPEHEVGSTSGVEKLHTYGSAELSTMLQQLMDEFRTEKALVGEQLNLQDQRNEEQQDINAGNMKLFQEIPSKISEKSKT